MKVETRMLSRLDQQTRLVAEVNQLLMAFAGALQRSSPPPCATAANLLSALVAELTDTSAAQPGTTARQLYGEMRV